MGYTAMQLSVKNNATGTPVNQQVVLRDLPKGMPVKTRIKAGLKSKLA
jgi:hypothetical protein